MSSDMPILRRDWLPQDLKPLLHAYGFDHSIAVQARGSEADTEFLLELAERYDCIAGVVGWVDLRSDELPERLERWRRAPKLVGFRHQVQDESDVAAFLASPEFRRGVARAQERSWVYEILVHSHQLAAVPDFCNACDAHWLVLDHLGKPAIRADDLHAWRDRIAPLARMPHVICKISGLVTEATDEHGELATRELPRYLDAALEIFGPRRLMFGSDWPVCLLAAPYAQVVEIVERWAEGLSSSERRDLWGETAQRIYGLHMRAAIMSQAEG